MAKYFDKFPIISYDGNPVRNILARTMFNEATKKNAANFVLQKLDESAMRPDLIADKYYDSPYYDWLLYYSNEVVDPYHDVFKKDVDLNKHIIAKYGSFSYARDLILYYRNNWYSGYQESIGVSQYEALPLTLKKYFTADVNFYNQITGYRRKRVDWTLSTNKIRSLTVDNTNFAIVGDIFEQYNVSNEAVARAQLVSIDNSLNIMTFKNIVGGFITTSGNYLKSKYINTRVKYTVSAVSNPSTMDNIPDSEAAYWEPITGYDYELENNEKSRNIYLLRRSQRSSAEEQLNSLLRS